MGLEWSIFGLAWGNWGAYCNMNDKLSYHIYPDGWIARGVSGQFVHNLVGTQGKVKGRSSPRAMHWECSVSFVTYKHSELYVLNPDLHVAWHWKNTEINQWLFMSDCGVIAQGFIIRKGIGATQWSLGF